MDKRYQIILSIFSVLAILSGSWWYYMSFEVKDKEVVPKTIRITGKAPAGFFDTIPRAKPIVKPITEPVTAPTIIKPMPQLNANMLPTIQQETVTAPSAAEIFREHILKESLYQEKFTEEVVAFKHKQTSTLKGTYIEPIKSFDVDFSSQGIAKETATYPVNLERVLTMNKHIPAVLYTEIRSEIPSQKVIAMVEQNITGYHGRKIIIPRGSQAIGRFESLKSPDSARLGIVWYRILTPEGINIKLTSEAVDQEGASGLSGIVDNRWKEKYGTALLFSSISALAQLSVPIENENAKAAADSFSAELGPIVAEQLRQSLDIVPRINIPKGARFNISPLVDIWLKKPKGSSSNAMPLPYGFVKGGS